MSRPEAVDFGGLEQLRLRLANGASRAAKLSRPGDWELYDQLSLGCKWPAAVFAALAAVSKNGWGPVFAGNPVEQLTDVLAAERGLLITIVLSPAQVLARLLATVGKQDGQAGAAASWVGLCWAAEAVWGAVATDTFRPAEFPGDRELLRPLAARLRFLALSEPMRLRGASQGSWWSEPQVMKMTGRNGPVGWVFGEGSWNLVVARCREARRDWLESLDSYQSHPLLALAHPVELEQELKALVFRGRLRHGLLVVSVRPLGEHADLTGEDAAVISEATEAHLLPRFQLGPVAALASYADQPRNHLQRAVWAVAVVLAAAAAVTFAALLDVHLAAKLAALCYVLIVLGVVAFGSRWAALWLLRLPAAGTVGLIALVGLLSSTWLASPSAEWKAAAVLAAAAYGYLVVEARNHGVAAVAALWRSAIVAVAGLVHAALVSVIGLAVLAATFNPPGGKLAAVWRHPGYWHTGMLLLLAATWCLAVGVFSQILWDDRPITAPLAHLQWRSGR
jgi:hypothetical protein